MPSEADGEAFETVSDIISLGIGIRSFAKNLKEGNIRGAIGDGVGIVFDAAAVFVPFMPGGVGYIRQGSRVVNLMDAGGDFLRLTGELQSFEKAAEFGVDTYKNLRKNVDTVYGKGSGLQVHHLIEKRLASKLGINEDDIPAIVLTKEEHQKFTNAWRNEIGYKGDKTDINTTNADADAIMEAAQRIYKDYPELLRFINECFK